MKEKVVGKIVAGLLVCLILGSILGGIGAASRGKIKITADKTEVVELNTAILTVTGTAGHKIHVEAIFGTEDVELETPETAHTGVPGAVIIEAFVRSAGEEPLPFGADVSELGNNGLMAVLMESGSLTTELSPDVVAYGDDFTLSGIALGSDFVDVLTVSPKGGVGTGLEGEHGGIDGVTGVTHDRLAVFSADWSYFNKIGVDDDADTGRYAVAVLSLGRDGIYNGIVTNDLIDGIADVYELSGKTQYQILDILQYATIDAAVSDDLMWVGYIKVESPYVRLNSISDVHIGEPLKVTGTTNRKDGTLLIITVRGPVELTPQTAYVANKRFNASFDTTDAIPGAYVVEADDGDGHTDTATVNILAPIT
jgi:hypothetical protein